ncbi:MAG: hypothetical protein ACK56F_16060 [bacterium]
MPGADRLAFARALGVPDAVLCSPTSSSSGHPINTYFKTLADHEAEAYRQRCAYAARFVSSFATTSPRLSRGAQSSAHSLSNAHR